jgi:fatty-acyl-CoA synthase
MGTRRIRAMPALSRRPTVPYPGAHAATTPDKPAVVMVGSGETLTYA